MTMAYLHPDKVVSVSRVLARRRARKEFKRRPPQPSRNLVVEMAKRLMFPSDRGS